jgi:hypothetical protein
MMLAPLMGDAIARSRRLLPRAGLGGTAAFLVVALALLGSEARYNWLPGRMEHFGVGSDPDIELIDWTSLRDDLAARGLAGKPGLIVAALKWYEAGKIDYALGGSFRVICLGSDPREYGVTRGEGQDAGADVLIIAPRKTLAAVEAQLGRLFDTITALPPVMVLHNGRPALSLPLFMGHNLNPAG